MSIAEKLIAVAENVPKVYKAGQSSMVDESKIVEKTVTGTGVVVIDDVSEIPHEVGCKVESVNLLNPDNFINGEIVEFNGVQCFKYQDDANHFEYHDNFEENTQYSFRFRQFRGDWDKTKYIKYKFVYTDGTESAEIITSSGNYVEYTSAAGKTVSYLRGTDNYSQDVYIDLSVNTLHKGDTARPYTPYVDVSGVTVTRCGENMFDVENAEDGFIGVGGEVIQPAVVEAEVSTPFIAVDGGTYTISNKLLTLPDKGFQWMAIARYDSNKQIIERHVATGYQNDTSRISLSVPMSDTTKYIRASTRTYGRANASVQLEAGDITDYKPYKGQTVQANADGTVEGIKSLCPVMTLHTNVDGVKLTVDYHKSWGKQVAYDAFWDAFQLNGTRTTYVSAFYSAGDGAAGGGWTNELFKPKYDIRPVGTSDSIFFRCGAKDYTKSGCGVEIDFSQATNFNTCFYASGVEKVGVIDLRNATGAISGAFQYCTYLKTIEKIILKDDGSQTVSTNMFTWSEALEEIRFEGAIGSNISFQWQGKLTKASITSIVNALYSSASGKTATFKTSAITSAFGSTTSQEWLDLVATKQNWTISLV